MRVIFFVFASKFLAFAKISALSSTVGIGFGNTGCLGPEFFTFGGLGGATRGLFGLNC